MDRLNVDSFRKLLDRCAYNCYYRGAILFNSKREEESFVLALQRRGHELGFLYPNVLKVSNRVINFKNGSRISLITIDSLRGQSYHEILYYKTVPFSTLEYARLREFKYTEDFEYFPWAYETEYDAKWDNTEPAAIDPMDREENNAELDRFLNSFKVGAQ